MSEKNNIEDGWIYVPEIDKEVEIEVHHKSYSYNQLKEIYGINFESMLLTKAECETIIKSSAISKILKMDGSSTKDDFFIQQYNEENKKLGYVAGFCVVGFWSYFYSSGNPGDSSSCRGVRFVRKKSSGSRKQDSTTHEPNLDFSIDIPSLTLQESQQALKAIQKIVARRTKKKVKKK